MYLFGLQQDRSEPSFSSTQSDPPLSTITLLSQEDRENVYPTIQVEVFQVGSATQQPTVETPLLETSPGTMLADSQLEQFSYKPHIGTSAPQEEEVKEAEEEQGDLPACGEEGRCLSVYKGLFGGLLSSVEVDFSDSPLGPTLSSVNCLLWPKTPETASVLNKGFLLGMRGSNEEVDSPSVDLQQAEIMTPDQADICLSQYTVETILAGGYFPQVSAVSNNTTCDTQR